MINVKVQKLHEDAKLPHKASEGAAAFDIYAHSIENKGSYLVYGTGLAFEVPEGHVLKLYPRSSVCKKGLLLHNSVGIIDSDYRGEVKVVFYRTPGSNAYGKDERIAQIILEKIPEVCYNVSDSLSTTKRDSGGFGSTGQ